MGVVRDLLVPSCAMGAQFPVVGFIRHFKVLRPLQLGIPRIKRGFQYFATTPMYSQTTLNFLLNPGTWHYQRRTPL